MKAAENEELTFMENLGAGVECTLEDCWENASKAPIDAKFVRVNKNTDEEPDVRARLLARDFKIKGSGTSIDLFAAMPPLEAKRLMFWQAVRESK